jgi:dienelactone hydrolase
VKTETITYKVGDVSFKGHLAYDDSIKGKRAGVLVVHEWWGLNDYARKRADQLAGLGYVAFAVDMYGEGKTTDHPKEAGEMAGAVRKNAKEWLARAKAGLKILAEHPMVDAEKLASIGYCFGGSTSLQLAFAGENLKVVVSFHGALMTPTDAQTKSIKAKILVCHGADDSFIPQKAIDSFRGALDKANVAYTFESYKGAVHSFTVPDADKHGNKGMSYNADADKKSWASMLALFKDALGK